MKARKLLNGLAAKIGLVTLGARLMICLAIFSVTGALGQGNNKAVVIESTSVVDFGRQDVGLPGTAQAVTFANSGSGSLIITRIRLTGANAGDFTITNDACTNATVTSSSTCTVTVNFLPTAGGNRVARLSVETSAGGSASEMPLAGHGLDQTRPVRTAGPIDLSYVFPLWYQDETALKLTLCLDANGMCIASPPDLTRQPSINDSQINFPNEAFWWYAEARITRLVRGRALLVLAKEAAFINDSAAVGQQLSFDRIRIRIDRLVAGRTYKVTHPFGIINLTADSRGEIDFTEDIGCAAAPCDFQRSLNSSLTTFLRWDPNVAPLAPTGYIGDPNVPHRVVGSPFGNNIFKVEGQNVGGTNVNTIQTDLFTVQGKIWTN